MKDRVAVYVLDVGRPWFGVSSFYAGLQLADFVAYLVDLMHNDRARGERPARSPGVPSSGRCFGRCGRRAVERSRTRAGQRFCRRR